jgi:hypothetical protein
MENGQVKPKIVEEQKTIKEMIKKSPVKEAQ